MKLKPHYSLFVFINSLFSLLIHFFYFSPVQRLSEEKIALAPSADSSRLIRRPPSFFHFSPIVNSQLYLEVACVMMEQLSLSPPPAPPTPPNARALFFFFCLLQSTYKSPGPQPVSMRPLPFKKKGLFYSDKFHFVRLDSPKVHVNLFQRQLQRRQIEWKQVAIDQLVVDTVFALYLLRARTKSRMPFLSFCSL